MAPIGVGIVGLSAKRGWAATAHVPALSRLDGFELRALSASSAESARAAADKYGVPRSRAFGSAAELAAADEVELVVVTVKVPDHREIIKSALAAGKTVLSEWPLGNGLAEAEELAAEAEARGVRGFVGLQARYAPAVRYLRDLVADGYVGEVLSTSVIGSGRNWGAEWPTSGGYLLDPANGATMLSIPMGHTLDGIASVLGEFDEKAPLGAVTANRRSSVRDPETGEALPQLVDDQIAVAGALASGAVASVHYRGGLSRGTNFLWEINGTEGDLLVTAPDGSLQLTEASLRGGRGEAAELTELPVPERYFEEVPAIAGLRGQPGYNVGAAYAQIGRDLAEGTSLAPDFAHAVRHQRLLDRIEHGGGGGR